MLKWHPWEFLKCRTSASFKMSSALEIWGPLYTTKSSLSVSLSKGSSFVLWRLTTYITDSETILTPNLTINISVIGVRLLYFVHEIIQMHYFVAFPKLFYLILLDSFSMKYFFSLTNLFCLPLPAAQEQSTESHYQQYFFGNNPLSNII